MGTVPRTHRHISFRNSNIDVENMPTLCLNTPVLSKSTFKGKSVASKCRTAKAPVARRSVVVRADEAYIGAAANWGMVANISAALAAGRFKKSPINFMVPDNKEAAYAAMADAESVEGAGTDPGGYSAAQVISFASLGHVHGIGMVLGLK